ncbi:MAG: hypothetical protein M1831_003738 [Alyxoria varia]|nr:MAG: hypothetical protein M1831_003738 [Alyxoria varia]
MYTKKLYLSGLLLTATAALATPAPMPFASNNSPDDPDEVADPDHTTEEEAFKSGEVPNGTGRSYNIGIPLPDYPNSKDFIIYGQSRNCNYDVNVAPKAEDLQAAMDHFEHLENTGNTKMVNFMPGKCLIKYPMWPKDEKSDVRVSICSPPQGPKDDQAYRDYLSVQNIAVWAAIKDIRDSCTAGDRRGGTSLLKGPSDYTNYMYVMVDRFLQGAPGPGHQ